MRNEYELILELCKFVHPDKERIQELLNQRPDMPLVLGNILFHRMGGVAYETLKKTELLSATNREFRNTLEAIYTSNTEKTTAYREALSQLSGVFSDIPIRYAFLKGAYLCSIYPVGLRTSNDVDVLISKESTGIVSERLREYGFKQGHIRNGVFVPATRAEIISSKMNRGETVPFVLDLGKTHMRYLEVDLNFSLDFQAKEGTDSVEAMLQATIPAIQTEKGSLYTLSSEDFVAHLCAHLYKEATTYPWVAMNRDLSLYKFSDLYLLYEQRSINWKSLKQRVVELGLEKECYYTFRNLCILYHIFDDDMEAMLTRLSLEDMRFMKQIYRPENKTYYQYDMGYVDWFFCPDRVSHLKEVLIP